jgi:hypothetical protein
VAHLAQVALTHLHLASLQRAAVEAVIAQRQETRVAQAAAAVEMAVWEARALLGRVTTAGAPELAPDLTVPAAAAVLAVLGQMDLVMETHPKRQAAPGAPDLLLQLQEHPLQERAAAAEIHKTQLPTLVAWVAQAAAAMVLTAPAVLVKQIPAAAAAASMTQMMGRLVVQGL